MEEGLSFEKERLEDKGYFTEDYIGAFYGIVETRPYMRGLFTKGNNFLIDGKYNQAIKTFQEILRLNNSDNLGAQYVLMAIFALLEKEEEMLELHKEYDEESFGMELPIFLLYYKLGNDKKAKEYLKLMNKINNNFLIFYKENFKIIGNKIPEYYQRGDISEVLVYFKQFDFLFANLPNIGEYVIKNSK